MSKASESNANEVARLRAENQSLKTEIDLLQKQLRGERESKEITNQTVTNMLSILGSAVKDSQEKLRKDLAPFAKTIKTQRPAFEKGRLIGAKTQKDHAAKTLELIKTMNSDLLKNADTARWLLPQRATHIEGRLRALKRTQPNGKPYKASAIQKKITGKG
jgi:hypothetical protein